MITHTMSTDEILYELEKDLDEVYKYIAPKNYRTKFVRRAIKNKGEFPITAVYKYKSSRYNDWVVQFVADGKRNVTEFFYAVYKTKNGYAAYHWHYTSRSWSVYTGHFFQRYNKRFLTKNYDEPFYGIDILTEYFRYNTSSSNHSEENSDNPALQGPSARFTPIDKDAKPTVMFSNDGVGLGMKKEGGLFIYTTFISLDILKEHQKAEVHRLMLGHKVFTDFKRNNGSSVKHELNSADRAKRAELTCKGDLFSVFAAIDEKKTPECPQDETVLNEKEEHGAIEENQTINSRKSFFSKVLAAISVFKGKLSS